MTSTLFFIVSKIVGHAIKGETWLILLMVLGLVALWRGWRRTARASLGTVLAALVVLTFVPVGHWAMAPLEARYPVLPPLAGPPDGIIVLGGSERAHV